MMRRIPALSILSLVLLGLISCGDSGDSGSGPTPQVGSVLVSPGELTLVVGESQQLNAAPQDEEGNPGLLAKGAEQSDGG
jgi:hypothetical protein